MSSNDALYYLPMETIEVLIARYEEAWGGAR